MAKDTKIKRSVWSLRIPVPLQREIESLAERDHRSVNGEVTYILETWVKDQADARR